MLEDPVTSYQAMHRVTDNDIFDNQLIFGDNLLALKVLEAEYAGKVKCMFIAHLCNMDSAFKHYYESQHVILSGRTHAIVVKSRTWAGLHPVKQY